MKLLKICFLVFMASMAFSACERQGEVINIVDGTPTKADTVLPLKFNTQHQTDSLNKTNEEKVAPVYKR